MSNRLPILVIIGAVLLFLLYSAIFVVNERQQAIVLRFGEIVDVKTEPGLYFKLPFAFVEADNVQIIEDRLHKRILNSWKARTEIMQSKHNIIA